jgi:CDP-diacylglycerol pyrophosphatase
MSSSKKPAIFLDRAPKPEVRVGFMFCDAYYEAKSPLTGGRMKLKQPASRGMAPLLLGAGCVWLVSVAAALCLNERGALWHVVHDICVPVQKTLSLPLPCLKVDTDHGFVVIRALFDTTRIIIVPTTRMEGIESPLLLRDDMPNLWWFAWNERNNVMTSARRPLDWADIGMAINSGPRRTQDQLHIHVDCVDPRLKRALASRTRDISGKWSVLDLRPWADQYRIKSIDASGLDKSIFKQVAEEVPGARLQMGLQSIGVVGVSDGQGNHGFAVLVNSKRGRAEELLDHKCSG